MAEQYWVGNVFVTVSIPFVYDDGCPDENTAVHIAQCMVDKEGLAFVDAETDGHMEPHVDDPSDKEEWKMKGEPHERQG